MINAGSDIITLTSINEGTPVSIIEAMASGKAVICTNVGGVKDIINNEVSGFICGQNADEFAQKISELMEDKNKQNQMGEAGRDFVLRNYSYSRLVSEVEKLYDFLLTSGKN